LETDSEIPGWGKNQRLNQKTWLKPLFSGFLRGCYLVTMFLAVDGYGGYLMEKK